VRLLDEDYEINLAEEKSPFQAGYIIASHPLTDENWLKFEPGKLKVFKGGEIVYS
ncbi:MAG: class II glutamine amidotransferase, partial [Ignavibacterium sp.]